MTSSNDSSSTELVLRQRNMADVRCDEKRMATYYRDEAGAMDNGCEPTGISQKRGYILWNRLRWL